jgi:2-polyprenyl-6-methoxyphenol hydroxylase-like FAD-dependent oxidoreductase
VRKASRATDNFSSIPRVAVNWFAIGPDLTRLYLRMTAERLRASGADRSLEALLEVAAEYMPEGAVAEVRQAGPIGFFTNSDVWSSRIAGDDVVLIGDAAGAPDPSQGHGTALLFRDVRELSDLLLTERDWDRASEEFAAHRRAYYDVILQYDRWSRALDADEGPAADRRRGAHKRAEQDDPTLGGFALIEAPGPDGLVADEAARRRFFGEDLT